MKELDLQEVTQPGDGAPRRQRRVRKIKNEPASDDVAKSKDAEPPVAQEAQVKAEPRKMKFEDETVPKSNSHTKISVDTKNVKETKGAKDTKSSKAVNSKRKATNIPEIDENPHYVDDMRRKAEALFEKLVFEWKDKRARNMTAEDRFTEQATKAGTFKDSIAAFGTLARQSPFHRLDVLDTLTYTAVHKHFNEARAAISELKRLFLGVYLPKTKLVYFENRDFTELVTKRKEAFEECLVQWYYEEQIKIKYAAFVKILETCLRDNNENFRLFGIETVFTLLRGNSELEHTLITILTVKLCDQVRPVALLALDKLRMICKSNPEAKLPIAKECQVILFNASLTEYERYYATSLLSQMSISRGEVELANLCVLVYLHLFTRYTDGKDPQAENTVLKAILKGLSRSVPWSKLPAETHQDSLNRLSIIVRDSSFNKGLWALLVIFEMQVANKDVGSRFYSLLFRHMKRADLASTSESQLLLHIVYKAVREDSDASRAKALIKVLLSSSMSAKPGLLAGILILLSEIGRMKPVLLSPVDQAPDSETKFNMLSQTPEAMGINGSCFWELSLLKNHFHPTVSAWVDFLYQGKPIAYGTDPTEDFSTGMFLTRFLSRTPKQLESSGKNNTLQTSALAASTTKVDRSVDCFNKFYQEQQKVKLDDHKKKAKKLKAAAKRTKAGELEGFGSDEGEGGGSDSDYELPGGASEFSRDEEGEAVGPGYISSRISKSYSDDEGDDDDDDDDPLDENIDGYFSGSEDSEEYKEDDDELFPVGDEEEGFDDLAFGEEGNDGDSFEDYVNKPGSGGKTYSSSFASADDFASILEAGSSSKSSKAGSSTIPGNTSNGKKRGNSQQNTGSRKKSKR